MSVDLDVVGWGALGLWTVPAGVDDQVLLQLEAVR